MADRSCLLDNLSDTARGNVPVMGKAKIFPAPGKFKFRSDPVMGKLSRRRDNWRGAQIFPPAGKFKFRSDCHASVTIGCLIALRRALGSPARHVGAKEV